MTNETKLSDKMAKFKVLDYNKALMAWFGGHGSGFPKSNRAFFTSFGSCYVLFYVIGFIIISSAVFVYDQWPNYAMLLGPCFIIIAGIQSGGMIICFGLEMPIINMVNRKLEMIIDKGKNKRFIHFNT